MSLRQRFTQATLLSIEPARRRNALTRNIATCLSPFRPDRYHLVVSVTCPTSTRPSTTKKPLTSIILSSVC
ncbi:hypothetical protein HanXRQr2_Chr16g0723381 [Helianthus annuus]|uniref:Uncharacterized protein n=1 Tax=Helianthus annuus TaxID=4232 RepID=A0A9K3GW02_HELAN|nr:hypothetical protein HanXRQr2_Chr16g0723381 [Helianthus annuus]KAJ0819242.1 hypothetical protein HanPSC8_Chr16g0693861 [Helianthus annuus]